MTYMKLPTWPTLLKLTDSRESRLPGALLARVGRDDRRCRSQGGNRDRNVAIFWVLLATGCAAAAEPDPARPDGSGQGDLPNPDPLPAIGIQAAALSPEGALAAVLMETVATAPAGTAGQLFIVRTADGTVVRDLGRTPGTRGGLVWTRDDRIVGWGGPGRHVGPGGHCAGDRDGLDRGAAVRAVRPPGVGARGRPAPGSGGTT
jgi:hypothetical protein